MGKQAKRSRKSSAGAAIALAISVAFTTGSASAAPGESGYESFSALSSGEHALQMDFTLQGEHQGPQFNWGDRFDGGGWWQGEDRRHHGGGEGGHGSHHGGGGDDGGPIPQVPEPTTWLTLLFGLPLLATVARRRAHVRR